jgi:rubredoxin
VIREGRASSGPREAGFVEFWAAGANVTGEFQCSECGYGVTIFRTLPQCPMCTGTSWEQVPWSPLTRAAAGEAREYSGS